MRRFVSSATAALLLVGVTVQGVSADTVTGPANVYVAGGGYAFSDRGQPFSGYIQVEDDRLRGVVVASVYFAGVGAERTCDAGTPDDPSDDYTNTDYVEFSPTSVAVTDVAIRSDLGAAKYTLRASGARLTFDACTGELTASKPERHTFAVGLKATGALISETNPVLIDNGDGTTSPGTDTYSYRPAAGKVSVDNATGQMAEALIQHVLTVRD